MSEQLDSISELAARAATRAAIEALKDHQAEERNFWTETRKRMARIETEQETMRQLMETFKLGKLGARIIGWLALIGAAIITIWSTLHGKA